MPSPSTELVVGQRTVRISNPDRVYFPERGETKLDLARYYLSVGEGIVRALRERPCMLHRYPEGVAGEKIYQKRLPKGAPEWVETAQVSFPSGRVADELCVTELASVIWAVQMSTVEFHPWHTRRADVEKPDELRIDLDPQPGTGFAEAKQVAAVVHEVLTELGAVGWPKTSGSKGVHIYVRIEPRFGFREVRRAALAFAREVERRVPHLVTTAWWKEERGAQIFVDYNQNAKDRTIASAYSVRGFPHGPVSAPVTWEELPDVEMADFTIATMPERFARLGDVHAGIDDAVWDIEPLLEWADRDETDHGLGDAPYPPNFPKQDGEPPRVQPSRMNKANWAGAADDVEPQQLD
ncbi:non-homologous end-joining DNA ligase [Jatrophihabitans cynanchi]|uniref:Non-homologous end-joining DNA ligase n=1 Tax=Jatrophihabitans cynanchi TaxID=2944128 RepID=A0ABY7JXP6_9ACTN|nr:non-homologous end-joining DNA ligase [Jatrophihabitans sp. SB3-54]WAX57340.1 non-homologous end-joining DNA ligase [Jatrophihabitans sp. SB3-54]